MHFKRILVLLILFPLIIFGQESKKKRVLFVGNSFTYMWNMPQMVEAMAIAEGVDLSTAQSTVGGSNFKQHWKREKNTKTQDLLENQRWDYVVLQGYSSGTIDNHESFDAYGSKLIELIKDNEAEPLLFMTLGI